jgi:hypothetical protein
MGNPRSFGARLRMVFERERQRIRYRARAKAQFSWFPTPCQKRSEIPARSSRMCDWSKAKWAGAP